MARKFHPNEYPGDLGSAGMGSSTMAASSSSTKRARGKKRKSASVDLSKLLPFISRSNLEGIISSSIQSGAAPNIQDLVEAVPENDRWRFKSDGRVKKSKPVKSGPERINTGLFNTLDNSIMKDILLFLNVKERHTVVSSTCKGWRELKTSIAGLFVDLSDDSWGVPYNPGSSYKKAMPASQVNALLDWVPSISDVTGLRISTQDKCNPNTCKSIIKKLATAKKKAKTSTSTLTKLVLHGPKIYGTLIAEMVKNDVGRGLTSLSFQNVKLTQQSKLEGSVGDLFRSCTQLEELYIPQQLATAVGSLRSTVLRPLSAARSGSSSLLRVLDVSNSGGFGEQRLTLSEISQLATLAPELEVLRLVAVSGCPTGTEDSSGFLSDMPMIPLPRLKEFSLKRIVTSFTYRSAPEYANTQCVNRLLTWLFSGMPAVESFSFGHGETSMSRKDSKSFPCPPLPGIGEIVWPISLKHLELQTLNLEHSTFDSNADMSSLETVVLRKCGSNASSIIAGLGRTHPNVRASEKTSLWG